MFVFLSLDTERDTHKITELSVCVCVCVCVCGCVCVCPVWGVGASCDFCTCACFHRHHMWRSCPSSSAHYSVMWCLTVHSSTSRNHAQPNTWCGVGPQFTKICAAMAYTPWHGVPVCTSREKAREKKIGASVYVCVHTHDCVCLSVILLVFVHK